MWNLTKIWWQALLHPEQAGALVLASAGGGPRGLRRFLLLAVMVLYAVYGATMGLHVGGCAAAVSALKLPLLFLLTQAVCLPAFYVVNCLAGPRFGVGQCLRLLLLATSANGVIVASYAPVSLFFSLTTSPRGYLFIALMHVGVFALSGALSVAVVPAVFRAAATQRRRRIAPAVVLLWGVLYAFVGSEMAWVLRPWMGWWGEGYAPLRPLGRSFVQALLFMLQRAWSG